MVEKHYERFQYPVIHQCWSPIQHFSGFYPDHCKLETVHKKFNIYKIKIVANNHNLPGSIIFFTSWISCHLYSTWCLPHPTWTISGCLLIFLYLVLWTLPIMKPQDMIMSTTSWGIILVIFNFQMDNMLKLLSKRVSEVNSASQHFFLWKMKWKKKKGGGRELIDKGKNR